MVGNNFLGCHFGQGCHRQTNQKRTTFSLLNLARDLNQGITLVKGYKGYFEIKFWIGPKNHFYGPLLVMPYCKCKGRRQTMVNFALTYFVHVQNYVSLSNFDNQLTFIGRYFLQVRHRNIQAKLSSKWWDMRRNFLIYQKELPLYQPYLHFWKRNYSFYSNTNNKWVEGEGGGGEGAI